jgi:hypothetical protein
LKLLAALKLPAAVLNKLSLAGKDIVALDDEQFPTKIGNIQIQVDLACLLRFVDKSEDKGGGIYLNTRKGKGLGSKPDTIAKRARAGETVSLLVFKRLMDEFSDMGEPSQADALHLYVRAKHLWCAPKAYGNRLKNLNAEANVI